ncbi:MAG: hypothetical protein IJN01_07700 [Rikenellaceae bacterium]|nr:hypothetical protein [Rikenellaceae bacterium]
MKRLILAAMMILFATTANAQKDVTKFLGIPVDGTKAEMIQKLKAKGFTSVGYQDVLEGEFNGTQVYVHVVTNNNKVYRIMVVDKSGQSERNIIIRFNKLCSQFENNKKYVSMTLENQMISEDEDISYEIIVNDKRYQAGFFQLSDGEGSAIDALNRQVWFTISRQYADYVIAMYYDNLNNQSNGEDL